MYDYRDFSFGQRNWTKKNERVPKQVVGSQYFKRNGFGIHIAYFQGLPTTTTVIVLRIPEFGILNAGFVNFFMDSFYLVLKLGTNSLVSFSKSLNSNNLFWKTTASIIRSKTKMERCQNVMVLPKMTNFSTQSQESVKNIFGTLRPEIRGINFWTG